METVRVGLRCGLLLAVALLVARPAPAAPLTAEVDEGMRRRALALNDVTGDDPIAGQIKLLAGEPKESRKLLDAALVMAKDPKNQPFNYNASFILANTADELKHTQAAKVFFRLCADHAQKLKSGKKLAMAYIGLTETLLANKEYAEAEKLCQQFLKMDDEEGQNYKSFLLEIMIKAIAKQGKKEEALKLADNFIKLQKDWEAYSLKASIQQEFGMHAEAVKSYENALNQLKKAEGLDEDRRATYVRRVRYVLSNVYLDMNNVNKAAEYLQANLKEEPDDPTYNNDLGYIWADHDMNLDDAEKMIRKAMEEDRKQRHKDNPDIKAEEDEDNPAYLDSLGWVLFKKKKYKEALDPLLKAVKQKDGQHIEILDHLAETHLALGEKDKAIAAWKKGLEVADVEKKREKDFKVKVEKKLKDHE
jgi:tetratricopeptide (TPR) repeat protein